MFSIGVETVGVRARRSESRFLDSRGPTENLFFLKTKHRETMSCCDSFLRGGLIFVLTLLNLVLSAFGVFEVLLGGYVAVSNSQVDTLSAILIVSGFSMSLLPTFMHQHYRSTCFSILYIMFLSLMIAEELFIVAGYVHPSTRQFVIKTLNPSADCTLVVREFSSASSSSRHDWIVLVTILDTCTCHYASTY